MTTETTKNNVKKKRILIVDDEPDVNMVLRKVFEQSGFNTDSYDDPVLALENYNAGSYDLVLLDIKMPEMDGFHLYKEMKKIDTIPFDNAFEFIFEHIFITWPNKSSL